MISPWKVFCLHVIIVKLPLILRTFQTVNADDTNCDKCLFVAKGPTHIPLVVGGSNNEQKSTFGVHFFQHTQIQQNLSTITPLCCHLQVKVNQFGDISMVTMSMSILPDSYLCVDLDIGSEVTKREI